MSQWFPSHLPYLALVALETCRLFPGGSGSLHIQHPHTLLASWFLLPGTPSSSAFQILLSGQGTTQHGSVFIKWNFPQRLEVCINFFLPPRITYIFYKLYDLLWHIRDELPEDLIHLPSFVHVGWECLLCFPHEIILTSNNIQYLNVVKIKYYTYKIFFLVTVLGVELRASHFLDRCATIWATLQALFTLISFEIESCFLPGQ
jgi:hypothetical protein